MHSRERKTFGFLIEDAMVRKLDDLNHYNSASLLVHTKRKGLIRLFCPFKVEVLHPVEDFIPGDILEVFKVNVSPNYELLYVIRNKNYHYYYFRILYEG